MIPAPIGWQFDGCSCVPDYIFTECCDAHDWGYLTGGHPTVDEVQAYATAWETSGHKLSKREGMAFFQGGTEEDRWRIDRAMAGCMKASALAYSINRGPWWLDFILSRVVCFCWLYPKHAYWYLAVRLLGKSAFNYRRSNAGDS